MQAPSQTDLEAFRITLTGRNATELLVRRFQNKLVLPTVALQRQSRIAKEFTSALRNDWGIEACCLFTQKSAGRGEQEPVRYVFAELCQSSSLYMSEDSCWVPVSSLSINSFADDRDFAAILDCFGEAANREERGFFARPGWLREVSAWVSRETERYGLCLTGEFQQFNASPTFSLIRFMTNGPALWFKAAGEPNLREFPVTLALARHFGSFVPRVLATRKQWNAWLALEVPGTHPDENSDGAVWSQIAECLSRLQLSSLGQALHWIDTGCLDVRVSVLRGLVEPFLESMGALMEKQTRPSPAPLSRRELMSLAPALQQGLSVLEESGIPDSLGHLDFNPGNVLVAAHHCIFLDWAQACVGHPFLTFRYLLEHARRLGGASPCPHGPIVSAYTREWQHLAEPGRIAAALRASSLCAVFAYAAQHPGWRDPGDQKPEWAAYLRSLSRRMKREADASPERATILVA